MLFNLGYGCLGYPMMAELLPYNYRTNGLTIIIILGGLFGFANSMSLGLKDIFGYGPVFLIYAGINIIGAVYLYIALPNM
jgi:hypothetical protein